MSATEQRALRIGEVAELVGVTPRTIRYYEELGLLGAAAARTKGAHRQYGEDDVARLRELIRLRDLLGLSLDELVTLAETEEARRSLRAQWHDDPAEHERARILDQAIELTRQQLQLLQSRRRKLDDFIAELEQKLDALHGRRRELGS
jgi:MerR family transcriptional regulator, repressor of the yfmOP operon